MRPGSRTPPGSRNTRSTWWSTGGAGPNRGGPAVLGQSSGTASDLRELSRSTPVRGRRRAVARGDVLERSVRPRPETAPRDASPASDRPDRSGSERTSARRPRLATASDTPRPSCRGPEGSDPRSGAGGCSASVQRQPLADPRGEKNGAQRPMACESSVSGQGETPSASEQTVPQTVPWASPTLEPSQSASGKSSETISAAGCTLRTSVTEVPA